jgi:protein-disulfide isomerase
VDSPSPANTQQQLNEILKQLRDLRALLEKQQAQLAELTVSSRAPTRIAMSLGKDWHVMGNTSAPITVVEFTDLECPFCHQFEISTFPTLKADYIDSGQIRFVSVDLPLSMHSNAEQAAEAVQCAGDQGKFWELRTALFRHLEPPAKGVLLDSAKSVGLNLPKLQTCLDTNKYKDRVAAEAKLAAALHIHATPTFAIGRTTNGKLTGIELNGALDYSRFQAEIDRFLADKTTL